MQKKASGRANGGHLIPEGTADWAQPPTAQAELRGCTGKSSQIQNPSAALLAVVIHVLSLCGISGGYGVQERHMESRDITG